MPITTYRIQPQKNNLVINLGLNNNNKKAEQIIKYLNIKKVFIDFQYQINTGVYNGQKESTLIIKGLTHKTKEEIFKIINFLNTSCTQECIAYKFNNFGVLQYNETYKGQKQTFNNNYFLTF